MIKNEIFLKILFSWMFLGSLLLAQQVTGIKFEGLVHLSPTSAKEIANIRVGEEMSAEKINDSIKSFFAQGYFQDVWVDKNGGVLIYHFKEKLSIANVEIKGYGTDDEGKKLLQGIGLKKGDLYDERRVKKAKKAIHSKLEAQGYYDTVVEVTTDKIGESSISVKFEVNKGEKVTIKKMNLIGAKGLKKSDVELDLANKEEDWMGWMPWRNNGEASVNQLAYDAYRVKDAYMKNGYLDAEVSKPLMRVDFGSYNAEVDYKVVEGKQYHVGKVSITQSIAGLNIAKLKDNLRLLEGKVFNINRMRVDIKNLQEEIGNLGYAYARIAPQMNKNTQNSTVDINYVIESGEVVTIGDVVISGNDITKDRVIRRYIYLAPGDKYNATDLKETKSALKRTGFFEDVEIETQRVTSTKTNLLLKVKETSTGTISGGGGYGSYEGFMVNASISDKNLLGSGITASLGFELSQVSKNYNLSFVNPKVWDSMFSLGMSFYKKDYEYIDYTQDQIGGTITLGREFARHFTASVGLGYVDNKSTYNNTYDASLINYYNDKYQKTSVFTSLSYDNTDDYYVPREGMKAVLMVEYGNLSGDDFNSTLYTGYGNLIKTSGKFGIYYGLEDMIDYDLILRAKGRFSVISGDKKEYMPIAERLFMGGMGSVRGFNPYSISPTLNTQRIGGTQTASGSLEASIPLSQAAKMRLAFFYDYGVIGSDALPTSTTTEATFDTLSRSSTGVVLEWQSSFGPINLIFASPIDKKEGDQTATFEFSMGSTF